MSGDAPPARWFGRGLRILLWIALGAVVVIALFVAIAFPWGPIKGLRVEGAEVIDTPRTDDRSATDDTPFQIAVTFSTPTDLARLREAKGAAFINAEISACEDAEISRSVAITQVASIFSEGHVKTLPSAGAGDARRYRYRATFEDGLPVPQGHTAKFVSAVDIGGGACFSLRGGSMWMGRLWSDHIPLRLVRPAAASPAG